MKRAEEANTQLQLINVGKEIYLHDKGWAAFSILCVSDSFDCYFVLYWFIIIILFDFLYLFTDQIYATLEAYQNSSENKNNFIAGTVNFTVKIYGPDDLDLDNIIYDWNFGDGTQLQNSHLRQLSHNFTTVASCTVMVTLHALSHGRQYTGAAYKNLYFKGMVWYQGFYNF